MEHTEKGTGTPVVFLHGFCETREMWKTFSTPLSDHQRILCPDLPGFGESPLNHSNINFENIAKLLQRWMEKTNVENPVVIGHSMGGYAALALAELIPLKALILFHSSAYADDQEKIKSRNRTLVFVEKHGVNKFIDSLVPGLFPEKNRKALKSEIDFAVQMGKKTSKDVLIAYNKAMRNRKSRVEILRGFPGKTMLIAGELDTVVPIQISRMHQEFVDNYHELSNTGHMGMFEAKEETMALIQKFLVSIQGKG